MECAKAVLKAREQVANALGAKVNEIYFTAGGSESDNWAIRGCAQLGEKKGKKHIITTAFEHHAVLQGVQRPHHGTEGHDHSRGHHRLC